MASWLAMAAAVVAVAAAIVAAAVAGAMLVGAAASVGGGCNGPGRRRRATRAARGASRPSPAVHARSTGGRVAATAIAPTVRAVAGPRVGTQKKHQNGTRGGFPASPDDPAAAVLGGADSPRGRGSLHTPLPSSFTPRRSVTPPKSRPRLPPARTPPSPTPTPSHRCGSSQLACHGGNEPDSGVDDAVGDAQTTRGARAAA